MKDSKALERLKKFSVNKLAPFWSIAPIVIFLVAVCVIIAFGVKTKSIASGFGIGIDFEGGTLLNVKLGKLIVDEKGYKEHADPHGSAHSGTGARGRKAPRPRARTRARRAWRRAVAPASHRQGRGLRLRRAFGAQRTHDGGRHDVRQKARCGGRNHAPASRASRRARLHAAGGERSVGFGTVRFVQCGGQGRTSGGARRSYGEDRAAPSAHGG